MYVLYPQLYKSLESQMEPKYLMKSDIQLNSNILKTKNDKRVL